jgi:hypothetical protein
MSDIPGRASLGGDVGHSEVAIGSAVFNKGSAMNRRRFLLGCGALSVGGVGLWGGAAWTRERLGSRLLQETFSIVNAKAHEELDVLLEIRAEIRDVTGMYLGPRQARTYRERLQRARLDRRKRRRNKVRRRWPGRADHKPPKPPRILKMGTILKCLAEKTLGIALTG